MHSPSLARSNIILTIITIVIAITIALSGLVIESNYSALIVGFVLLAVPLVVFWLKRPIYVIYAYLIYSFLPFGIVPATPYYYINRFFPILVAAIWLFDVVRRRQKIVLKTSSIFMFGFILWSLVTLFWAPDLSSSEFILQLYFSRLIIFVLIIPNMIRTRDNLNHFMNALTISGWLLVIACLVALLTTGFTAGVRFQVFEENSNYIGVLALMMLAGVAWKACQTLEKNIWFWKLQAYLYLLASIGIVAMTGSRGSALSLLIILFMFVLSKPTRTLGFVGFGYLIFGLILAPILFSTTIERFSVFDQANTLLGGRELLWPAAWMLIKEHPWVGVGIGNSPVEILPYLQYFTSILGDEYASSHNPLLTIWMETGIPGFILYVGSLVGAVVSFIRLYIVNWNKGEMWLKPYINIVGAVFLGYMVSWIKGGGIESDKTYFLMLTLLLVPVYIDHFHPSVSAINSEVMGIESQNG